VSRVITFSERYPRYHPKAGKKTYFVESILRNIIREVKISDEIYVRCEIKNFQNSTIQKKHTIRAGNRWKVGDKFSPRVWTGVPYQKPGQIKICDDLEVKRVYDIDIVYDLITGTRQWYFDGKCIQNYRFWTALAFNDGFEHLSDLSIWLSPNNKDFNGQIIIWDEQLEYKIG